jgi:Homeodomain-like domain
VTEKYTVKLTKAERNELCKLIMSGEASARKIAHARILLKADAGEAGPGWSDEQISAAVEVGLSTVARVRERCVREGLEAALARRKPNRQYVRLIDGEVEAHLVALACSEPPNGAARWSLRLLADQMVALGYVEAVSHEVVRQALKKTN